MRIIPRRVCDIDETEFDLKEKVGTQRTKRRVGLLVCSHSVSLVRGVRNLLTFDTLELLTTALRNAFVQALCLS
ncbi:hypothetical protein ABIE85_006209 [Bradyrhizobium diazoefficiens]